MAKLKRIWGDLEFHVFMQYELPLNAEYPAYVYLEILKIDKQEFIFLLSSGGYLFSHQIVWLKDKQQRKLIQTAVLLIFYNTCISSVYFVKVTGIDVNHCDSL